MRKTYVSAALFLSLIGLSAAGSGLARDRCLPVNAVGYGQDQGEGQTVAFITGGPLLVGRTQGNFQVESVAGSLASVAGTVAFETIRGKFTLVAKGSFDLASGTFTTMGPIEDGSGVFADTRGYLKIEGTQNLETGYFGETISGSICWPR